MYKLKLNETKETCEKSITIRNYEHLALLNTPRGSSLSKNAKQNKNKQCLL